MECRAEDGCSAAAASRRRSGEVSRELGVSPVDLEEWRRVFLERGQQGLKSRRGEGAERELMCTRAKLGEMTMRMELAAELLEKRGFGQELRKLLRRGSGEFGTGRRYPLTMVCEVWRVARSTVYTVRARGLGSEVGEPGKRGPKTELSDEALVEKIREVLGERLPG